MISDSQGSKAATNQQNGRGTYQSITTWQSLTRGEQEKIRRNLATIPHAAQSGYSQGSYGDTQTYWETLSESDRQLIITNLIRNSDNDDLSTEEQQNIRKILIAAITRYQRQYGVREPEIMTVVRNRTSNTVYDENHNIISHSESSTEYSLGHDGEAGSSFNNR